MAIPAGVFKTEQEVIITKRGRPVAKLVPFSIPPKADIFGCMKGSVTIVGDIVGPLEEQWSVDT